MTRRSRRAAALALLSLLLAPAALAGSQDLPRQHIRLTLPATPDGSASAALDKAGVRLLVPFAPGVYLASAPRGLDPALLKSLGANVEPLKPADKLHPLFQSANDQPAPVPAWAALGLNARGEPMTAANVLFHPDVPLGAHAAEILARHDGVVRTEFLSARGVFAELPASALALLAAEDEVMWIEPPIPALQPANADARARMEVDPLHTAPYDLTGAGVEVLVFDGGRIRATHRDLVGRVAPLDPTPMDSHATHVAGIIAGDGTASGGEHRGTAPGAYLFSAGFQSGGGVLLHTNPGDIETDYAAAHDIKSPGRLISNNSLSANISSNGYDCELLGDYGVTSGIIDAMVTGALGEPMIVLWAGGNERASARCPGPYGSVPPPATAKNPIVVGAVNSNDDSIASFSSFGPTDDGRLAPVVVAPGCQVGGDNGITSLSSGGDSSYRVLCGTSMAAPAAAGVVALLMEDWRAQFPSRPDPSNASIKAILAHTAVDLGNPGPDYVYGYGSIRAHDAVDLLRTGNLSTGSLVHGQSAPLTVNITAGTPALKLTLAWDDAPAAPGAPLTLVNDLDLVVTDPLGARHYPWTLNPVDPAASAVRTAEDHVNNIEQVLVDAPAPGEWTVQVVATNIPSGTQTFSLASSADLNLPSLQIFLPGGVPETIQPAAVGAPTQIPVRIVALNDTVDPASPLVAWREAGGSGPFSTAPLTHLSGDDYLATIPAADCGPDLELFFAASGLSGAVAMNPPEPPALDGVGGGEHGLYSTRIGEYQTRFHDTFDTDTGWSVENVNVTDGGWDRGVPAGGGLRGDPPADADGSGGCWLTDNVAGNSDLDGGPTILISPTLDASGAAEARASYWRWYNTATGAAPMEDPFRVEVSADNGVTWALLEEVAAGGADGSGGWRFVQLDIGSVAPLTSEMRFRFIADDIGNASIIEAAIDGFRLEVFTCGDHVPCLCELTSDSTTDVFDLLVYLDLWFAADPAADLDGSMAIDVFDLLAYLDCWFAGC